jgi:hypothetical protein
MGLSLVTTDPPVDPHSSLDQHPLLDLAATHPPTTRGGGASDETDTWPLTLGTPSSHATLLLSAARVVTS